MTETNLISEDADLQKLQQVIVDALCDGVYFVDKQRRILYWNNAAERMTGYQAEEVLGRRCADGILRHCNSDGQCLCGDGCPLAAVMEDGKTRQAHVFMHHADGHRVPVHVRGAPMYDRHGRIIGAVEVFSDDTDRMTAVERLQKLERDALLDDLTGLANRRYFNRAMSASFNSFYRHGQPFGLLLIDVDHFKQFNDTHGHEVGDNVLQLVAQTLAHSCRAEDTPARWGGEEFAVISDNATYDSMQILCERLRALVSTSYLAHGDEDLSVTVSVGAALVQKGDDAETIVRRADEMLYKSKQDGRNRVSIAMAACQKPPR